MTNNTMQDDRSTATRAGKDHRTRTRAPGWMKQHPVGDLREDAQRPTVSNEQRSDHHRHHEHAPDSTRSGCRPAHDGTRRKRPAPTAAATDHRPREQMRVDHSGHGHHHGEQIRQGSNAAGLTPSLADLLEDQHSNEDTHTPVFQIQVEFFPAGRP